MYFPPWVKNAVAYQIFPDRFSNLGQVVPCQPWGTTPQNEGMMGGTLNGIRAAIPYLQNLGINFLYLNPIFKSPSNHRYDTSDYFSVDSMLGTDRNFDSLVSSLHDNDIILMLDIAFNHTSNMHPRFLEAINGHKESRDWYHIIEGDNYEKDWVRAQGYSYLGWWGYPNLPKLNVSHVPVRLHHMEVLDYWSNKGVDAFRFDVPSDIPDSYFWNDVGVKLQDKLRIAELWWEQKEWLKDNQMQGQMNYPLLYSMLNFFASEQISEEKLYSSGLGQGYFDGFYQGNKNQDIFLDTISRLFALSTGQDSLESKIAISNLNLLGSHDTARIASYLPDKDIRKQLFAFMFFSIGMPCIYYGDETGMKGNRDPDNRRAFNWDRSSWDLDLFDYVKSLISFRKHNLAFLGDYNIASKGKGLIEVIRENKSKKVLAIFNRSDKELRYQMGDGLEEVVTGKGIFSPGSEIFIPSHGVRIFKN